MPDFVVQDLPFAYDALEPFMSRRTLEFHHDRHLAGYVATLNRLKKGTRWENCSIEEIIRQADGGAIFNNAAQIYNHNYFFQCLSPATSAPPEKLLHRILFNFGTLNKFKAELVDAGTANFGSGWTWLVIDPQGSLKIINTANAQTPLTQVGMIPLLNLDVWEHAYYLDYQNRRADYLKACVEHLNWDFIASHLHVATDMH